MLKIGKSEKLYNRDNKHYYRVEVFLSTLNELKWANNFAKGCHQVDRRKVDDSAESIHLYYFFKHQRYVQKFIKKLEKFISYQTA